MIDKAAAAFDLSISMTVKSCILSGYSDRNDNNNTRISMKVKHTLCTDVAYWVHNKETLTIPQNTESHTEDFWFQGPLPC